MLPGKNGLFVCKELRSEKIDTPVLMLTAKSALGDKVNGLNMGADDYLAKPFAFEELLARVRALLRRNREVNTVKLKVADLELDQVSHKVTRQGKDIELTVKEYAILEYLMLNEGGEITRTMLLEHIWREDFEGFSNIVDVYIKRLREKIDKGSKLPLIHTVKGVGYILKAEKT